MSSLRRTERSVNRGRVRSACVAVLAVSRAERSRQNIQRIWVTPLQLACLGRKQLHAAMLRLPVLLRDESEDDSGTIGWRLLASGGTSNRLADAKNP
jgi:hypothetical protein